MDNRFKLTYKKRSQTDWLLWVIIIVPFLFAFLIELLKLPYMIRYAVDIAWVLAFFYILFSHKKGRGTEIKNVIRLSAAFFIYTALAYIFQYQSIFYYLWGVRSNFRFFVAFVAVALFLKEKDISYYFKALDIFFWINVAVTLIQYFGLGLYSDNLGGLFGTEVGVNSYTCIFLAVVLTKSMLDYLAKRVPLVSLLLKSAAALLIVALAEIKFFFFLYAMIIVLAIFFTNFTWRKFWVVCGCFAALAGFAVVLTIVFPGSADFLTFDFVMDYAGSEDGYTGRGDINRLNAISVINEMWLTDGSSRLFGMGLGNCDAAGFDFLITPFYETYGTMHYSWFSHAFMYLETGWIGLVFYYGFFVLVFFEVWKIEKKSEGILKNYCTMSRILAVCSAAISIYNVSLRMEAGYIMFFALAIPFALDREHRKKRVAA